MKIFALSKRAMWIVGTVFVAACVATAVVFGAVVHIGATKPANSQDGAALQVLASAVSAPPTHATASICKDVIGQVAAASTASDATASKAAAITVAALNADATYTQDMQLRSDILTLSARIATAFQDANAGYTEYAATDATQIVEAGAQLEFYCPGVSAAITN